MKSLAFLLLGSAFAISACAAKPPASVPEAPPGGTAEVRVKVTGFANEEGQVLIALFLNEKGWPDDEAAAFAAEVLPIQDHEAVAVFEDVPAGPYAVSVFHDEDRDRELDTGLLGIPTEDYGFSRDARDMFGPPSFEDARLEVGAAESMSITIKVE